MICSILIQGKFYVSIPSNGSIQFLRIIPWIGLSIENTSLNPLKRVNSILTLFFKSLEVMLELGLNPLKRVNSILTELVSLAESLKIESQSPQTGQFNSYTIRGDYYISKVGNSVSIPSNGSIQFLRAFFYPRFCNLICLVSIPSNGSIQFLQGNWEDSWKTNRTVSQSPQTGQFNSYTRTWYRCYLHSI